MFDACAQHLPRRLILGLGIRRNGLCFLSASGFWSACVGLEVCFDIYLSMIAREENAWPKETFARRRSRAAGCDRSTDRRGARDARTISSLATR
jgi:hypothetical protein